MGTAPAGSGARQLAAWHVHVRRGASRGSLQHPLRGDVRAAAELVAPGTHLEKIIAYRQKIGNAPTSFPNYATHVGIEFRSGANSVFEFALEDGRTIRINHLALPDGGYVATHEDVSEVIEARSARALADARATLVAELERR